MKKDQIMRLYQEALSTGSIQSKMDIRGFLEILKEVHRQEVSKDKDFEQSWKGVKGNALEKVVEAILERDLKSIGLSMLNDSRLPKNNTQNPKTVAEILKAQLIVDYGQNGQHIPDADLIVYRNTPKIEAVAILSIKSSLRERIAQVAYWTGKVKIPYFFITADSDDDFMREISNKSRAIAEKDTGGVYVITENDLKESAKVKHFSRLLDDLKSLVE